MGKRKKFTADINDSQTDTEEAVLDEDGNPLPEVADADAETIGGDHAGSLQEALDPIVNGEGSEAKKPEDASSAASPSDEEGSEPAQPASVSTDEGKSAEEAAQEAPNEAPTAPYLGAVIDTADLKTKEPDGTVLDDHNTTVPVEAPAEGSDETKGQLAAEAAKIDGDDTVTAAPPEATATDSASSVAAVQHSIQVDEDARQDHEPAVGSAEYLEATEKAQAEMPKVVDPATLPGMAPVATIGETEAVGGIAPPVTAIDGVSKGDTVPALGEVHEAAKPLEEALDGDTMGGLKAAGDQASDALHRLKDAEMDLAKLPDGAREIAAHVRAMGLHFVAALEAMFKRQ